MKELPIEFTGKGEVRDFRFRQLKRTENAYLYEVTTETGIHYEVFEHRVNSMYGTVTYPGSKSFGVWAYCIRDLQRAKQRLSDIERKLKIDRKRLQGEQIPAVSVVIKSPTRERLPK
jgi:hypothetical protein